MFLYCLFRENGYVGIGITPTGRLQVAGDEVRIGDAGTVNTASADGDLYVEDALEVDGGCSGALTCDSDIAEAFKGRKLSVAMWLF